jgi:predicted naringenin-chalcone synthase
MAIRYPWMKLKPGEGFFVPGLDVMKVRELGLRAALPHRINALAVVGIKGNQLGVWFYRKFPASQRPARS